MCGARSPAGAGNENPPCVSLFVLATSCIPCDSERRVTSSPAEGLPVVALVTDRKSTRLNSSHLGISYAASTYFVPLSLHDALPISLRARHFLHSLRQREEGDLVSGGGLARGGVGDRSEEHTSELQSLRHLLCCLHLFRPPFPTRRSSDLSSCSPLPAFPATARGG